MTDFQLDAIYLMDCLEGMKMIPDGSVDAIICDLPYEVLHKNNPHAQWDRLIPFEPLWREYLRVAKHNAAIVLFCQGMFTAQLMMSQPKLWRYNLVWDKCRATGFLNANRMPLRYHEDIAVFYRKLPTYNPQFEDCYTTARKPNHSRGNGTHNKRDQCYGKYHDLNAQHIVVDGNVIENQKQSPPTASGSDHIGKVYERVKRVAPTNPNMKFPGSIIHIKKEHERTVQHPTQKPVELLRYLIRTFTNEGETVLDNCMGSGTTAVAAVLEHRHFIGFELNADYHAIATHRVKEAQQEPLLF